MKHVPCPISFWCFSVLFFFSSFVSLSEWDLIKTTFPRLALLQVLHTSAWPWPSGAAIKNVSEKETISIYVSRVCAATRLRLTVPFNHKTVLPSYVLKHTHSQTHWNTHAERDACCLHTWTRDMAVWCIFRNKSLIWRRSDTKIEMVSICKTDK